MSFLFLFFVRILFLRNSHLDHSIHHSDRIRRDIHHSRQLHGFPCPHIELAAMPRADDVIAFEITVPQRAIIVGTDIGNRKELVCDIEDDN